MNPEQELRELALRLDALADRFTPDTGAEVRRHAQQLYVLAAGRPR